MPKLTIVWDPEGLIGRDPQWEQAQHRRGVRFADLDVTNDIENIDRYHIARRLAELLLEQLP